MKAGDIVYFKKDYHGYLEKGIFLIEFDGSYYFSNCPSLKKHEGKLFTESEAEAYNLAADIEGLKGEISYAEEKLIRSKSKLEKLITKQGR